MVRYYEYIPTKGLVAVNKIKNVAASDINNFYWVDFENPTENEIKILEEDFKFHPLAVEDCVNKKQRPKLDDYKDYILIIMYVVRNKDNVEEVDFNELAIFVGKNFIVTFHWEKIDILEEIIDRTTKNPAILEKGNDYLLYLIIDNIVDGYFPLLDSIDEKFTEMEAVLLKAPKTANIETLFILKRKLLALRRVISPEREVLNYILRFENPIIKEEHRFFYLDVYDHLVRTFDFVDNYRELISGALEIYLSVVSNRLNQIMKTLTIIATIMMPLTLISSIYGMNFKYMPELYWKFGYPSVLGLMIIIAMGFIVYFRRKKWM